MIDGSVYQVADTHVGAAQTAPADDHPFEAFLAPQIGLPLAFDAGSAYVVARAVALVFARAQLIGGNLVHVAEGVTGQRAERVVTAPHGDDFDAGLVERGLKLGHHVALDVLSRHHGAVLAFLGLLGNRLPGRHALNVGTEEFAQVEVGFVRELGGQHLNIVGGNHGGQHAAPVVADLTANRGEHHGAHNAISRHAVIAVAFDDLKVEEPRSQTQKQHGYEGRQVAGPVSDLGEFGVLSGDIHGG